MIEQNTYQEKLRSKDFNVILPLLQEIVEQKNDFTEGDLFIFLVYKRDRSVIEAVLAYPEVQEYVFINPISSDLSIPELIKRLKELIRFDIHSMKPRIMDAYAKFIRSNRVKHELLYEQLEVRAKDEKNLYERGRLLAMIPFIKRPEEVPNPFMNLLI
jgi:hypothetical protein